jgi:hypothetical protein
VFERTANVRRNPTAIEFACLWRDPFVIAITDFHLPDVECEIILNGLIFGGWVWITPSGVDFWFTIEGYCPVMRVAFEFAEGFDVSLAIDTSF